MWKTFETLIPRVLRKFIKIHMLKILYGFLKKMSEKLPSNSISTKSLKTPHVFQLHIWIPKNVANKPMHKQPVVPHLEPCVYVDFSILKQCGVSADQKKQGVEDFGESCNNTSKK